MLAHRAAVNLNANHCHPRTYISPDNSCIIAGIFLYMLWVKLLNRLEISHMYRLFYMTSLLTPHSMQNLAVSTENLVPHSWQNRERRGAGAESRRPGWSDASELLELSSPWPRQVGLRREDARELTRFSVGTNTASNIECLWVNRSDIEMM